MSISRPLDRCLCRAHARRVAALRGLRTELQDGRLATAAPHPNLERHGRPSLRSRLARRAGGRGPRLPLVRPVDGANGRSAAPAASRDGAGRPLHAHRPRSDSMSLTARPRARPERASDASRQALTRTWLCRPSTRRPSWRTPGRHPRASWALRSWARSPSRGTTRRRKSSRGCRRESTDSRCSWRTPLLASRTSCRCTCRNRCCRARATAEAPTPSNRRSRSRPAPCRPRARRTPTRPRRERPRRQAPPSWPRSSRPRRSRAAWTRLRHRRARRAGVRRRQRGW
jgi:hypothetical protein